MKKMITKWAISILIGIMCIIISRMCLAYVPLIDEVEGIPAGYNNNYLIFPAWENLNPGTQQKAYFIIPKYLVLASEPNVLDEAKKFGVVHKGFCLFPNGKADGAPSAAFMASIELYKNDSEIIQIQNLLTERDRAAGLQAPVFPTLVFSKFNISLAVIGLGEPTLFSQAEGGYVGQTFLLNTKTLNCDVDRSFVLDLPPSAGRDANLWGVIIKGVIPGYGNRLKCSVTFHHKQIYEHFRARSTAQAYWGLVKSDLSAEIQRLSESGAIDFGLCRGDREAIDKIVFPVWETIVKLINDDDGKSMFADLLKNRAGLPDHPEASDVGWGFQGSVGWESISAEKSLTVNFDISYRMEWELPLAMSFNTTCSKYRRYIINQTNPNKPCVSINDITSIIEAQKTCRKKNIEYIEKELKDLLSETELRIARKMASIMGCAYDGRWHEDASINVELVDPDEGMKCRGDALKTIDKLYRNSSLLYSEYKEIKGLISQYGCDYSKYIDTMSLKGAVDEVIGAIYGH